MKTRNFGLAALAATLAISTAAFAEPFKSEAVITKVEGSTISARTVNGPITVHVTPETVSVFVETAVVKPVNFGKSSSGTPNALIVSLVTGYVRQPTGTLGALPARLSAKVSDSKTKAERTVEV